MSSYFAIYRGWVQHAAERPIAQAAAYPPRTASTPARLLALLRQIAARPRAIAGHGSAVSS
jgi:hypothetical protein